jgi:hypothetical protein
MSALCQQRTSTTGLSGDEGRQCGDRERQLRCHDRRHDHMIASAAWATCQDLNHSGP